MFSQRTNWNLSSNALTRAVQARRSGGGRLLDLTISNPTEAGIRFEQKKILSALAAPASLAYQPEPLGMRPAREAVAAYYQARGDAAPAPGNILLTTSTSEAYSFVFRLLCNSGEEVLAPVPSYPLFEFLATLQDVRLRPYGLLYDHGWQMDLHALRQAITPRTRAIIVVNPNNPTGSFVKPQEMAELARLCREHELAIVADEVFLDYAHAGPPRPSFAQQEGALTFTMSGLSKVACLPQMKLAWLVTSGPRELAAPALERLEVIADTYLSVNAPIQHALPHLLALRGGVQAQLMARVEANVRALDAHLAGQPLARRLEVEGGWYAVLRLPAVAGDEDLAVELVRERGVLAHPGHFFDFSQEGYLVLSLITPEVDFACGVGAILDHCASHAAR